MDILLKQDENTYMSFLSSVTSAGGATVDIMVDEMPTASASELKKIYHYIGVTDANYTHGHFYECQSDGSGGYEWVEVQVQVDKAGQTIQLEALPTASADLVGTIYQYVGNTTLTHTNGWFYKCIEGETTGTYEWVVVEMCKQATTTSLGTVKPDGTTIVMDPDGTIHALGGGKIRLENVSGATVTSEKTVVSIRWTDPPDVTQGGIMFAQWAGTKIMKKVGSAPTGLDDEDATLLIDSTTRNAYSSTALTDNNVVYGTTYYYKFFPYTADDVVTAGSCLGVTPSKVVIENVPTQSGTLSYTGEAQTPSWTGYNSDALTLEVTAQTNVGSYTATFTPKSDYIWWDGTTTAKTAQWNISNIVIAAVPTQSGTLSYTGTEQTPTWSGYDTDELTISGDTAGTAIGTYTVTFTPKTNYEWYDGTTTGKTATWEIGANVIATIPTQQGTLVYNGAEQTAVWNNFNTNELTIANSTGTNAGTYIASFTPKLGFKWSDGTTTAKTVNWIISKAQGGLTLSQNSITFDENVSSATITYSNATGIVQVESSDTTKVTVTYNSNEINAHCETNEGGTVNIIISISETENYMPATVTIPVKLKFSKIYGFKINKTDSNPATCVAPYDLSDYTVLNTNYVPAYMDYTNNTFNYGSWAALATCDRNQVFFAPKPCMLNYDGTVAYYLDPADFTKKTDGTASDIADSTFDGNAMVEFPTIWFKRWEVGNNIYVLIANEQVDSDFHAYAHHDKNGNILDYIYIAMYLGQNSKLRSLSGTMPATNVALSDLPAKAQSNNTVDEQGEGWYICHKSDYDMINNLLVLIGMSTDTQTTFGNGIGFEGNSTAQPSGMFNNKGAFYGTNGNNDAVVTLFIENWWGNIWDACAGWICDHGNQKVKMTYGTEDGSSVVGFNLTGNGYISIPNSTPTGTTESYMSSYKIIDEGFIPLGANGGSQSTYVCDYFFFNNSILAYAIWGGAAHRSKPNGAFMIAFDTQTNERWWTVGSTHLVYKSIAV